MPDAQWTAEEIIVWLTGIGIGENLTINLPLFEGPYIPDMPDRVGVVTPLSGAGETLEGVGDILGFQLLVRGDQNAPSSGQRLALAADRRIRFGSFPTDVAGGQLRLARVMRSGGGPAVLAVEDDGDRVISTCNYLTEILR